MSSPYPLPRHFSREQAVLQDAGVETWADLAGLSDADLRSLASRGLALDTSALNDDTAAAIRAGVTIPVLQDSAQLVARSYGATASGEAVALEAESLTPVYRGAIEDAVEVDNGNDKYPKGKQSKGYCSDSYCMDKSIVFNALNGFSYKE